MIAKKFPNGATTFFQMVNFYVKATFDALILCLEFRRMFEIWKLKRVLENVEAISSYSHEYVQMGWFHINRFYPLSLSFFPKN